MPTISLLVRVALACVFVVSGVAKILDRSGTKQAVSGFGVPARLVSLVAISLAPLELGTAVLLLPDATARLGLLVALAVLVAFTLAVVLALRAGRVIECHCFGRIGGADISLRTVTRNVVLGAACLIGLAATDAGGKANIPVALALGVLSAAAVVSAEGWAGRLARTRKERADEEELERSLAGGSAAAVRAPEFRLPTLSGGEMTLESMTSGGRPALLVFMMPGCGPCKSMRPAVARWVDVYSDRLSVAVMSRYNAAANAAAYVDFPQLEVIVDEDAAVTLAFGVIGTPSAVLVGPDGSLRGGVASGERLVRRLLAAALAGEQPDLGWSDEAGGASAETINLDSVAIPRQTVTRHDADDAVVLVDEETGAGATLDPIGGVVWAALDGTSSLRDIVADLSEEFGAPQEVVGPDVIAMVRSLGRSGLLQGIAAEPISDDVESLVTAQPVVDA